MDATDAPGKKRAKLDQQLRQLEVEAYCAIISAFRAQGDLTWKKAQLLQDLRQVLRIPEERHKMELKRVTDDEALCEIAKLSSSLNFAESELDATAIEDAKSKSGRKKGSKQAWGDNKDKTLPYLDAVPAPVSSQPPNLSKIPPAAKESKSKGKSKAATPAKAAAPKATPAKSATPTAAANRKRKATTPTPKKASTPAAKKRGGSKAKAEVKTEDAPEMNVEETPEKQAEEADEDEAHIKEVEEQLRAKQEQLLAELAALQAEMADEGESEGEEEGPNEEEGEEAREEVDSDGGEGLEAME